jgi:hypothetical protein
MLVIVCAAIVFFFLAIGAAIFVLCGLVPPLRKYALSSALWCAVWGPCTVAWLILGGTVLVANHLAMDVAQTKHFHLPDLPPRGSWIAYAVLYLLATMLMATLAAWAHQFIVHRITFALFRIYAGLVSAGIGSVWGWCLWFWIISSTELPYKFLLCVIAMLGLCIAFGYAGFRWAGDLRGGAPTKFAIISPEEFEATA